VINVRHDRANHRQQRGEHRGLRIYNYLLGGKDNFANGAVDRKP
jgi:hypothetical protein